MDKQVAAEKVLMEVEFTQSANRRLAIVNQELARHPVGEWGSPAGR